MKKHAEILLLILNANSLLEIIWSTFLPEIFLSYQKRIHECFHNLATFCNCTRPRQMIYGWEQSEVNKNITRNGNRSDILTLLTLLNADAKLAVLLRVLSLTRVEVLYFPLLHFPRWFSLIHQSWTKHLWTFSLFSTISLHHKWYRTRLLWPAIECTGCFTSCGTT